MPTPDIAAAIRYADGLMLKAFTDAQKVSVFNGLVRRKRSPDGVAKFASTFMPAAFKVFTGEAKPVGVDARNQTITTKKYKNPVEIDEKQLRNTKAIVGDEEFMAPIRSLGADAVHAEDEVMSAALEANGNDVLGSAFFAAAAAIPNSAQTITNTQSSSGVTDPDDVRADFYSAVALWDQMKNAAGRYLHGTAMAGAKPVLLFPPGLRAVMEETFEQKDLAGGGSNPTYGRVELRCNPYFADTNDWFLAIPPASLAYPIILLAHDYEAPLMQTNWGAGASADGGMVADRDAILRDKVLFNADWDFECGLGWRAGIIRTVSA